MSHPLYAAPKKRENKSVPHTAYQVDYVAVNCGRIVAASKRRIRFKFGYTNVEALEAGKTGQDCRGSEHEVVITWSLSSGKQAIAFDQHEVYFDVGESTQTKISHAFKDQHGHVLEVKVHAANMSTKTNPDPDWKQYDLLIDGVSFFRMPKIYEIGIFPKDDPDNEYKLAPKFSRYSSSNGSSPIDNRSDMGFVLPAAETKASQPEPPAVADLLSFDDFDAPPAPSAAPAPVQTNNYAPPEAPAQVSNAYAPPQPPAQANFYAPPQAQEFAPAPTQFQQTYAPPANQDAAPTNPFGNPQAQVVSPTASPVATATFAESNPYNKPSPAAASATNAAFATQPAPVTPAQTSTALVPAQTAPTANYSVDGGVQNLVNLDNLFGAPAAAPNTSFNATQEANAHQSLGQLQGSNTSNPKKPVMNPFNEAPAYGQHQASYNGYATQQPQFNNFAQQPFAQPGFGY